MIKLAAVKLQSGHVYTGKTHGECLAKVKRTLGDGAYPGLKVACENHVQGFINDNQEFKTREEAWEEAFASGQVTGDPRELTSEDLFAAGTVYN